MKEGIPYLCVSCSPEVCGKLRTENKHRVLLASKFIIFIMF